MLPMLPAHPRWRVRVRLLKRVGHPYHASLHCFVSSVNEDARAVRLKEIGTDEVGSKTDAAVASQTRWSIASIASTGNKYSSQGHKGMYIGSHRAAARLDQGFGGNCTLGGVPIPVRLRLPKEVHMAIMDSYS